MIMDKMQHAYQMRRCIWIYDKPKRSKTPSYMQFCTHLHASCIYSAAQKKIKFNYLSECVHIRNEFHQQVHNSCYLQMSRSALISGKL